MQQEETLQSIDQEQEQPRLDGDEEAQKQPHASAPPGPPLGDGETKRDAADEQV